MLDSTSQSTDIPAPSAPPARNRTESSQASPPVKFVPHEPQSFADLGLGEETLEGLVLKLLLYRGTLAGRAIAENLHLPRLLVVDTLETVRAELLIAIKGSAGLEDYFFQLTEAGYDRARRLAKQCTYTGAAPVPLEDYIGAVGRQSLQRSKLRVENLEATFSGLRLSATLISQLGQAISEGRGMFLYGPPGNGKTSVSELVVSAFGESPDKAALRPIYVERPAAQ